MQRLQNRARLNVAFDRARIALQMLFLACFLASHRIPGHLLLASVLADIESVDAEHQGPILMAPQIVALGGRCASCSASRWLGATSRCRQRKERTRPTPSARSR